jgi:hypothetical protein
MPIFVDDFGCISHSFEAGFTKRKNRKHWRLNLQRDTSPNHQFHRKLWMNPGGAEA